MKSLPVTLLLIACWAGACSTKSGQHASRDAPSHDVESGSQRIRSTSSQSIQSLALSTGKVTVEHLVQVQLALLEKQESIVADQAELARRQQLATEQMQEMDQLVQQQQKMVVAQVALSRRQEAMADQLKELTIEVNGALGQLVMEFEMLQPKAKWHARQIEKNHNPYTAIYEMLVSLDERVFPTRNTWYGEAWQRLSEPYLVNQFPSVEQRDELVRLLDRIVVNERRRISILRDLSVQQYDANEEATGYCLGSQWQRLRGNLKALRY